MEFPGDDKISHGMVTHRTEMELYGTDRQRKSIARKIEAKEELGTELKWNGIEMIGEGRAMHRKASKRSG